jgi:choline monooxygenase
MTQVTPEDVARISTGYDPDPARSWSLRAEAYTERRWADADVAGILARSWQWIGPVERLRDRGSYVSATVAGMPVAVVRGRDGELRSFYNVCKHRARSSPARARRATSCAPTTRGPTDSTAT